MSRYEHHFDRQHYRAPEALGRYGNSGNKTPAPNEPINPKKAKNQPNETTLPKAPANLPIGPCVRVDLVAHGATSNVVGLSVQ